jgi:hypothetical protein
MSLVKTDQLTNLNDDGQVEVLEGLKVLSGKKLSVLGPFGDSTDAVGTSGQILTSTVSGVLWKNPTDLNTTYAISATDGQTANKKIIRLTAGGSGTGTDDVSLSGDTNITLSRNGDDINFSLAQNITSTSNVTFNNITANGDLTIGGIFNAKSATGKIRWSPEDVRWQFTNDGTKFYNFLLPTETVYDVAAQYGASGDGNRYLISSGNYVVENSQTYLRVVLDTTSDIQYFTNDQYVKIFGASTTEVASLPVAPTGLITIEAAVEENTFNDDTIPHSFYTYVFASYKLDTGDVSPYVISNTIVENLASDRLNEANYNRLTITRNSGTGILVYRAEFPTSNAAQNAINNIASNRTLFKLISVLGPKEFTSDTLVANYIDYGAYDVPVWTNRNSDGTFKEDELVHFPINPPALSKRGWAVGAVKSVDGINGVITIDIPGLKIDTNNWDVYIYHDDTVSIQTAINELSNTGTNFFIIPGGTYLVDQLKLPDGFTLRGLDDATVFKKQYWTTTNLTSTTMEGFKNSMFVGKKYDFTKLSSTWGLIDFTLRDMVIDGNSTHQILYDFSDISEESNNAALGFPNSEFVRLKDIKIRNTSGPALFAEGSLNFSISNSSIFDGMETERYGTPCILMSDSENTTISSSFFRNYPGALDFTTGKVLAISGSVIRNCGAGIQIYGSVNTDVLDNIILGPADEFIPVPDLYDTDYDGVNISVTPGIETQTPVYQFQTAGENKDLSNTIINFDVYSATVSGGVETVNLNSPLTDVQFEYFNPIDVNLNPLDNITVGQIRFKLPLDQTNNVPLATVDNYLVYRITGIDYVNLGSDIDNVLGSGQLTGKTPETYEVNVTNQAVFNSLVVGDYVKLVSHDYTPDTGVTVWRISSKVSDPQTKIELQPYTESPIGILTPTTIGDVGDAITLGGGYLQLREKYVIAKGVVSRVQ